MTPHLRETSDAIEIEALMPTAARVAIGLFGLVPLLAPYELLIRPGWPDRSGPFFVIAALFSIVALGIGVVMIVAAVAGTSSLARFDRRLEQLAFTVWSPTVRRRVETFPFRAIDSIDLYTKEWSDGDDTYSVRVTTSSGKVLDAGSFSSQEDAARLVERLREMVAQSKKGV